MLPMEHALEHALPTPQQSHHPWRTIAVVAAGIATLELIGLVIAGTALFGKPVAEKAARAAVNRPPAAAHKAPPARPILPRRSVGVTVLNANGIAGAAAAEASQVRTRGYKIRVVGNAPGGGRFSQKQVMDPPGRRRLLPDDGHVPARVPSRSAPARPRRRHPPGVAARRSATARAAPRSGRGHPRLAVSPPSRASPRRRTQPRSGSGTRSAGP